MNELTDFGHTDLAYKLLESDRFPSWLYSIRQGATTIWERWDGYVKGRGFQNVGMNSFNHYAIGAVGEWMYKVIAGIRPDTSAAGFSRFIIQPEPGGTVSSATGSYNSVNGIIATHWEKKDNGFTLNVTVPVNTSARIRIGDFVPGASLTEAGHAVKPGNGIVSVLSEHGFKVVNVGSGEYTFTLK